MSTIVLDSGEAVITAQQRAALEAMVRYFGQIDDVLAQNVIPSLRSAGSPLAGQLHSLRQEFKLQASAFGGGK